MCEESEHKGGVGTKDRFQAAGHKIFIPQSECQSSANNNRTAPVRRCKKFQLTWRVFFWYRPGARARARALNPSVFDKPEEQTFGEEKKLSRTEGQSEYACGEWQRGRWKRQAGRQSCWTHRLRCQNVRGLINASRFHGMEVVEAMKKRRGRLQGEPKGRRREANGRESSDVMTLEFRSAESEPLYWQT
ncbi:hypothetical protein RUM44_007444 [Polyplax serrata]|uniref:Uncharacterized protein n=1 Tax=Polyplax serrata TaxID=468196 RepID=A0ABR1B1G5_POLSC